MPFTLAHPAAVLPLLRHPFVPAALVAGSMAPDTPYFLTAAGITSTSADDWYGSFLNATHTHSVGGLPIDLLYAVALLAAYRLIRAPIAALLGLTTPQRPQNKPSYAGWLLISATIGIATHLLWDALTEASFVPAPRLLQYASTVFGLAVVTHFLWKHRAPHKSHRLSPAMRRTVLALLIAAPLLAAAAFATDDYTNYRAASTSWTGIAEGVLTGAAKRAGAAFAFAVLIYALAWHTTRTRQPAE
jgi:hypothetical protein